MDINKFLAYFPEDWQGNLKFTYKQLLKSKVSKGTIKWQLFKMFLGLLSGTLKSKIQDIWLPKRENLEFNREQEQREQIKSDRAKKQHSDTIIFVESLAISGDWKSTSKIQGNFKDRDSLYEELSAVMPAYR